jgi:hypothetical protein
LQPIELGVETVAGQELGMGSLFFQLPPLQHQDAIHIADGGETVGDDEGSAIPQQSLQSRLEEGLGAHIQASGSLIQDQDLGIPPHDPQEADELLLAAGKVTAPLPHRGGIALGQAANELVQVKLASNPLYLGQIPLLA